jgi:hypothetical protein
MGRTIGRDLPQRTDARRVMTDQILPQKHGRRLLGAQPMESTDMSAICRHLETLAAVALLIAMAVVITVVRATSKESVALLETAERHLRTMTACIDRLTEAELRTLAAGGPA